VTNCHNEKATPLLSSMLKISDSEFYLFDIHDPYIAFDVSRFMPYRSTEKGISPALL